MAQFDQLGSPYSVTIGTPSLTVDDLVDAGHNFDPELHEHFNGKSRFVRFSIGNDNTTINFTTTDKATIAALIKGMEVQTVKLTFKGTYTNVSSTAPAVTQSAVEVSATISTMKVVEAVEVTNNSDKAPAQFAFTLRACQKESDGSDPTIAFAFSASEPEGPEE